MKNKILILLMLFVSLIACSSDEKPKEQEEEQQKIPDKMQPTSEWPNLLLGKWEISDQCSLNAISGAFTCRTPSLHSYNFISESLVIADGFIDNCSEEGNYNINEDDLSIQLSCGGMPFEIESEIHVLDDKQMILVFNGEDSILYRIYKRIEN